MNAMITHAQISPVTTTALPKQLLEIDTNIFRERFNRCPFKIRHRLADHALFTLPRLIELAHRLPGESVEYNAGNLPLSQDPQLTPRTGLSVAETIRRIEECCSWMVLKNVEDDPAYRELLDQCLDQISFHSEPLVPGMYRREAYIFISSPDSVTPYHIDNEYNFLLQIRGRKTLSVFDPCDRTVLSDQELERYYSGAHRNLVFENEYQARATMFDLIPGIGLHVPLTAPHWVRNGPEVSVSFSITFRTPASEFRDMAYRVNAKLRRLGLQPVPPGQTAWRDVTKIGAYRAWRRTRRWFGKGDPGLATQGGRNY
jgi:Cupin-like domain